ncbi:N-acetylmuramate alpha-1-phosphate uridylyltransferase [Candidatus Magnetaquicoccaceae bacterium FCR-1]|uniref:N-acetylmuramate alpha-1-phosphate uridylyltransferase n=1 Tax=Candidatus Magnetaquiglobus chichijimensis TaxID=3141448 RepID=A0ABQ0CBX4_9PROT
MQAMILAAGYGKRLRPLTDTLPKPLVEMGGRPLLDHTLTRLAHLGVRRVVINVHHLADRIVDHVGDGVVFGLEVVWSREESLLETGGGVRLALSHLGAEPFLAVNGDVAWDLDLASLVVGFDETRMDGRLGLVPTLDGGRGDFSIDPVDGRLCRSVDGETGWIYSGLQMIRPGALEGYPIEPFSLNRFYDDAIRSGRLFGVVLEGFWADIGTPERLERTRAAWKNRFAIGPGLAYKG